MHRKQMVEEDGWAEKHPLAEGPKNAPASSPPPGTPVACPTNAPPTRAATFVPGFSLLFGSRVASANSALPARIPGPTSFAERRRYGPRQSSDCIAILSCSNVFGH